MFKSSRTAARDFVNANILVVSSCYVSMLLQPFQFDVMSQNFGDSGSEATWFLRNRLVESLVC